MAHAGCVCSALMDGVLQLQDQFADTTDAHPPREFLSSCDPLSGCMAAPLFPRLFPVSALLVSRPSPSPLAMETVSQDSDHIDEVPRTLPEEAQEAASSQDPDSSVCTHIEAYVQFSGQRVGLAGVGSGKNWGKIPTHFTVDQMKRSIWIRILTPPLSPDQPVTAGVNYEPMPLHWAPNQVWFEVRRKTHGIGAMGSLLHRHATADTADATMIPVFASETPEGFNAEKIFLAAFEVISKEVVVGHSAHIDLGQVPTPRTPSSIESRVSSCALGGHSDPIDLGEVATPRTSSSIPSRVSSCALGGHSAPIDLGQVATPRTPSSCALGHMCQRVRRCRSRDWKAICAACMLVCAAWMVVKKRLKVTIAKPGPEGTSMSAHSEWMRPLCWPP